jgi:YHS domain-containing protein
MSTTYKGKMYYFCCTGCRDAFKETPDKYIKEFEERQAAKAKERAKDDDK